MLRNCRTIYYGRWLEASALHFAVVGGGSTGTESAAELNDFVHQDLVDLYPGLQRFIRITVYDVANKALSMFDENLAEYTLKIFQREGIEVKTQHHVLELWVGLPISNRTRFLNQKAASSW